MEGLAGTLRRLRAPKTGNICGIDGGHELRIEEGSSVWKLHMDVERLLVDEVL